MDLAKKLRYIAALLKEVDFYLPTGDMVAHLLERAEDWESQNPDGEPCPLCKDTGEAVDLGYNVVPCIHKEEG